MKTLDLKSLLVGAVAATALILNLGVSGAPTGENGRFRVAVSGDGRAVMVDSATGQAWATVLQNVQSTPDNFYKVKNNN